MINNEPTSSHVFYSVKHSNMINARFNSIVYCINVCRKVTVKCFKYSPVIHTHHMKCYLTAWHAGVTLLSILRVPLCPNLLCSEDA